MFLHHTSHNANHWHILGAGAIGCLWASQLIQQGMPATLLVRPERLASQNLPALLTVEHPNGSGSETVPIVLESSVLKGSVQERATPKSGAAAPISQLLVTTKAGDTLAALAQLRERLTADAMIVLLQNGMGHQQQVMEAFPGCAIFAGSTTDGVWQQAFLHIHRAGYGLTRFGALNKAARRRENRERLQSLLTLESLKAEESDNMFAVLQQKLAINAAINGLTVLYNCPNGELLKPELQPHVASLCRETETILAHDGFHCATPLLEQVNHVLTITAANISSSLQDVRNGRSTELAYINGYLLDCAERTNIPAPAHRQLMQALRHKL